MRRLVLALALVVAAAGCSGGLIRPRVEKGIRNALPDYIGPAKEYTVRADGSTRAMMGGLIERLHIEGEDVQVDPKLLVAHIAVDMDEVRYDTGTRRLESVRQTTFQATISESAVNHYIAETRKGEPELHVKLQPSKALVQFAPAVAGVNVPVSVAGRPVVGGKDKVNFVADSASVAHLPVPAYVVNKMLERVNPILDMSLVKFPVTLRGITVGEGTVLITGSAEFEPAASD